MKFVTTASSLYSLASRATQSPAGIGSANADMKTSLRNATTSQKKTKRGRPRRYAKGSTRLPVTIEPHVLAAWKRAGGTDLAGDIAAAFAEKFLHLLNK